MCEPDRWSVPDHREDYQSGRSEDFGPARERLWPHLFHNQQQTRAGQVWYLILHCTMIPCATVFELSRKLVYPYVKRANKPHHAYAGNNSHKKLYVVVNVILNPDFLCEHAGPMWLTEKVPSFTRSCVGLWACSFLSSSSLVWLWTPSPKSNWMSCWVKVQLGPSLSSQYVQVTANR